MSCDPTTVLRCMPFIGPFASAQCLINDVQELSATNKRIDPQGLIQKNDPTQEDIRHLFRIKESIFRECTPILQKIERHAVHAIIGDICTLIAAPVCLTPELASLATLGYAVVLIANVHFAFDVHFERTELQASRGAHRV